jgi:hypothetical protein
MTTLHLAVRSSTLMWFFAKNLDVTSLQAAGVSGLTVSLMGRY